MEIHPTIPNSGAGTLLALPPVPLDRVTTSALFLNSQYAWPLEGDVTWGYISGVRPQSAQIKMLEPYAQMFVEKIAGKVSLQMIGTDPTNDSVVKEFKNLWLLIRSPADFKKDTLLLTDDRFYWSRPKVTRVYNATRKSNDVLVFADLGETAVPGAAGLLQEAKRYFLEQTIINDETGPVRPYTALDIAIDILTRDLGYPRERINAAGASKSKYTPLNQFLEGVDADAALDRYLTLGGNSVYLDENMDVVIYSRTMPLTELDFKGLFPGGFPQRLQGEMWVVDYTAVRPRYIETQFKPEAEMLFTCIEGDDDQTVVGGPSTPATTPDQASEQLFNNRIYMTNVTRTVVPNQVESLPRGTIVAIEDGIKAFGSKFGGGAMTMDQWREFFGGDGQLVASLAAKDPALATRYAFDAQAIVAYNALARDYRSLFQVPKVVMDQILDLNPVLVDILNPETGTRAPSEVYSIMTWVVAIQYRHSGEREQAAKLNSFKNRDGSSKSPYTSVPAIVTIEDKELGLIRINWLGDIQRQGAVKDVFPGEARDDRFYLDDLGAGMAAIGREGTVAAHGLKADWEMSVILSVVPMRDNTKKRLFKMRFTPPKELGPDGKGPPIEVFVSSDTARFALDQRFADYIDPNRHITELPKASAAQGLDAPGASLGIGGPLVNSKIVEALGLAESDRLFATFANQLEGQITMGWSPAGMQLRPIASMVNVLYTFASGGVTTVSIAAQRLTSPPDIMNFLPESVLRVVYRQLKFEPTQGKG